MIRERFHGRAVPSADATSMLAASGKAAVDQLKIWPNSTTDDFGGFFAFGAQGINASP